MNLAPKKPNWDLKRDVEKKLAKLDKRTKKAIIEILSKFGPVSLVWALALLGLTLSV